MFTEYLAAAARRHRILIIDDAALSSRVLAYMVRDIADVEVAVDGESGLMQAVQWLPDLILLDVEMPGMNGFEVCKQLKEREDTRDIPVIFVTSCDTTDDELMGLEAGAVDFISKPFNPPIALQRIRTHLTLKHQSDMLRELASRDGLTGAFNRRYFDQQLNEEVRRHLRAKQPLALLMVDIDFFKNYNDIYGHPQGDLCLKLVAKTLAGLARRPGEFVARYGGEEFAVVLPNTDADAAPAQAEQIRASIAALAVEHRGGTALHIVTLSIGIAILGATIDNTDALLAAADMALYRAKALGRNSVVLNSPSQELMID